MLMIREISSGVIMSSGSISDGAVSTLILSSKVTSAWPKMSSSIDSVSDSIS